MHKLGIDATQVAPDRTPAQPEGRKPSRRSEFKSGSERRTERSPTFGRLAGFNRETQTSHVTAGMIREETGRDPLALPESLSHLPVQTVSSGAKGGWTKELNNPKANAVYRIDDRHLFVTDGNRRVEYSRGIRQYTPREAAQLKRNEYQQRKAGGPDRLTIDQGGHLYAASHGGPGEGINVVAQSIHLNQRGKDNWAAMESDWLRTLKEEPGRYIASDLILLYGGDSKRPTDLGVIYDVDGRKVIRWFENVEE